MCYSQKGLLQVTQHNDSDLDSVDTVRYLRAGLTVKGYMLSKKKKLPLFLTNTTQLTDHAI